MLFPSSLAGTFLSMRLLLTAFSLFLFATTLLAQKTVSFPTEDRGVVYADVYGQGGRGVLLAHGGQFNKESWHDQAVVLANAGFLVLAIDFRGYGPSHGPGQSDPMGAPLYFDVLAGVHYLRAHRARSVAIVGASMGGWAAADAAIRLKPGLIDGIVFLGSSPGKPEKLTTRSLFLVARDDTSGDGPRLPGIRAQFEKTPEPKQLIVLQGKAHAQFLFGTDQGAKVMDAILHFLSAR